jgi:murein DD-endopeptidase MepM/ murein hydrolase activator NlpD
VASVREASEGGGVGRPRSIPRKILSHLKRVGLGIISAGKQRFTVMFIPHTEKRVINFQINAVTIAAFGVLLVLLVSGFFYLSTVFSGSSRLLSVQAESLEQTEASLETVLDELQEVVQVADLFDQTLTGTIQGLGLGNEGSVTEDATGGDLSAFLDVQEITPGELREIQELRALSQTMRSSIEPLNQIRAVLQSQEDLLRDLPNFWPLAGGRGRVTMEFGPNIHPVTGQWYLHKGFDIADSIGVPVLAAANGKVVELGVDPGYGLHVWIRHKYGFRTHYSHLQSITVAEGEDVVQGQRIGTLGNTGISTGPHLDFQIVLGTDVVDPSAFLKISNDFRRWSRLR